MFNFFLESKLGQIVFSIILGLGLAAVFRKACTGPNCLVIQGPKLSEVNKYVYKLDEECYKYTPYATACESGV